MKRFRRVMVNALTVLSLVLALLVTASWVRSYSDAKVVAIERGLQWAARSEGGVITLAVSQVFNVRMDAPPPPYGPEHRSGFYPVWHIVTGRNASWWTAPPHPSPPRWGFRFYDEWQPGDANLGMEDAYHVRAAAVAHWVLALLLAVAPACRFVRATQRRAERRRRLPGHCLTCDYDLRATPDRCPECGTVPQGR